MFIVPAHIFNPANVRAGIVATVISGGQSLNGDDTAIQTDGGGRWQIDWTGIDIDDPETERLWDAWVSYLAGGARPVLVPILSLLTAPRPFVGGMETDPSDIITDDPEFPTTAAFASPHIIARIVSDAALRATTVEIDVIQGARVQTGSKFSVGNRAYLIERVTSRSGLRAVCTISPPLREPLSADDPVNFEWPVVQCRAALGQSLNPDMAFGKFAEVAISFVEDFSTVEAG